MSPIADDVVAIGFDNRTAGEVQVLWVDFDGERVRYMTLPAGERGSLDSFEGHLWEVTNVTGEVIGRFVVASEAGVAVLSD